MWNIRPFILILVCFLNVECLLDETEVEINILRLETKYTGKKGTAVFLIESHPELNVIDTSKGTCFQSKLLLDTNPYVVKCGFFKAERDTLYMFCNLEDTIPSGNYTFDFNNIQPFTYKNYKVTIKDIFEELKLEKLDVDIIDLYSDPQTITVVDNKDSYDLKFNISSYHQEKLILRNYFIDCTQNENELTCPITKKFLEKFLYRSEIDLTVSYIPYKGDYQRSFYLVPNIKIIYNYNNKIDVYINIIKLIENVTDKGTYIAYETNVTDISNIETTIEAIKLYFENERNSKQCECSLKKYDTYPLLLLCSVKLEDSWLKDIDEAILCDDCNIKYNFIIPPTSLKDKIDYQEKKGTFIDWIYPDILDFRNKDTLIIDYALVDDPGRLTGITLNEKEGDLNCEITQNRLLRCIVPKSHFKGMKSGYYFTKHTNHLNGKSTSYEGTPIKVILEDSPSPTDSTSPNDNSKGNIIWFNSYYLLLLIILFMV